MSRKPELTHAYNRRIRLSSREILLALAVTIAAVAFVTAARHVASPAPHGEEQGDRAADSR